MTLFPDKQKKAQEEISRVVGSARLPDFNNRESLPYVDCLLKEVHRLNPVGPLAVPHKSTKDDSYNVRLNSTLPPVHTLTNPFRAT